MRSDDLQARFKEILAGLGGTGPTPGFSLLWTAFLAFAAIPVDDAVEQPGSYPDAISFWVDPEEDRPGTRMGLSRAVERPNGPIQLVILAHFEPLPVAEFDTSARGGSVSAVREFQHRVEADPGFQLLKSAAPVPHEVEYHVLAFGPDDADVADGDGDGDGSSIRSDQVQRRFGELLEQRAGGAAAPSFAAIWSAFMELALIPVRDAMAPGTDDDYVEIFVAPEERQPGPRLTLSRYVVRRVGAALDLWVIADYEPFPLHEKFSAIAIAGVESSVAEFARTVECSPVFQHLQSASPTRFEFGVDEVD